MTNLSTPHLEKFHDSHFSQVAALLQGGPESLAEDSKGLLVIREKGMTTINRIDRSILTIGRSSSDNIVLQSKGVSRCHATLFVSKGGFWIIDGNLKGRFSTNGLFVNERRVTVHRLNHYDRIKFQQGVMAFYLNLSSPLGDNSLEDLTRRLVGFIEGQDDPQIATAEVVPFTENFNPPFDLSEQTLGLDVLTKLPNRDAFFMRVRKALECWQKAPGTYNFAVLFIDVDRFKVINDSLGHLVGDQFLIQLSNRLETCLREDDIVARLGGDEFAILLANVPFLDEAVDIAKRLQQSLVKPLKIEDHELYPSISIGIALSSLNYQTVEEIIRDADTAMYHAKNTGRSRFVVFDIEMHQKALELLRLDGDLRKAIDNQELQLHYQPIVSLKERKLVGFEALIRWYHPKNGLISPDIFIPVAEDTNLIYPIGQWVLDEACHQLSQWKSNTAVKTPLSVSINISSKQLTEVRLVERLLETIGKYNISPSELKLEVTESILMESTLHSMDVLNQLKQAGFQLGIDDFGTGYSSLSYLNKFPIDTLKVDRSFIAEIDTSTANTSVNITNSIITLAHSLGVKVVAEGIERLYHLAWLQQQKCDYGQGFLFAKPLNANDATKMAEQGLDWPWQD